MTFFLLSKDFDNYSSKVFAPVFKTELETYLEEKKLPRVENMDVLNYWSTNQFRFPILSQMARDVLTIPLSTVASESAFSVGGRVFDAFCSFLKPRTVEAVICLIDWVFGEEGDVSPLTLFNYLCLTSL